MFSLLQAPPYLLFTNYIYIYRTTNLADGSLQRLQTYYYSYGLEFDYM